MCLQSSYNRRVFVFFVVGTSSRLDPLTLVIAIPEEVSLQAYGDLFWDDGETLGKNNTFICHLSRARGALSNTVCHPSQRANQTKYFSWYC